MQSYKEPLTSFDVNSTNLDVFKKKLQLVHGIPDRLLISLEIESIPKNIDKKREIYFSEIQKYIQSDNVKLLKNIININNSNRKIIERYDEHKQLEKKLEKSIKQFKDKHDKTVVVRLLKNVNRDKIFAFFHYLNYKKISSTKPVNKLNVVDHIDDFILKKKIYGMFIDDLMIGFMIIESSRKFVTDFSNNEKIDTFYIQEIYIDHNYRRRNLASILIQYAVLRCPLHKNYISLMTYESNPMMIVAQKCCNFVLQETPSGCPINTKLLIKCMSENDYKKMTVRISKS